MSLIIGIIILSLLVILDEITYFKFNKINIIIWSGIISFLFYISYSTLKYNFSSIYLFVILVEFNIIISRFYNRFKKDYIVLIVATIIPIVFLCLNRNSNYNLSDFMKLLYIFVLVSFLVRGIFKNRKSKYSEVSLPSLIFMAISIVFYYIFEKTLKNKPKLIAKEYLKTMNIEEGTVYLKEGIINFLKEEIELESYGYKDGIFKGYTLIYKRGKIIDMKEI